jgi:protein-S-isoprenylcysteine O-methyltransferase Ste14
MRYYFDKSKILICYFKIMRNRLLRFVLVWTTIFGSLFMIAGTWEDPWLWVYACTWAALLLYALFGIDEDLARERFRPPTRGADRAWLAVIQIVALAHLVLGALDLGRWHLAAIPAPLRALAFAGMAGSAILVFASMQSNRYFSSVVRIQHDRGHRVVDSGPYARVRHPGYAGMIPLMAFSGLALGSWLAFALGLIYGALILRRALFEDRFLHANLTGYREYAERVPYRLLPGVW